LYGSLFFLSKWKLKPPIQGVPGALSLGLKLPEHEADHSPPSSGKVKECMELYIYSSNTPSWRGAQLKKEKKKVLRTYFSAV
jgi:hypothetical protein